MKKYATILACTLLMCGCRDYDSDDYATSDSGTSTRYGTTDRDMARTGTATNQTSIGTPGQVGTESATSAQVSSRLDADIRAALQQGDANLPADAAANITVMSSGGTVTLKGNVNSQAEKDAIIQKVTQVSGVQTVNADQLMVSGQGQGAQTEQGQSQSQPQQNQQPDQQQNQQQPQPDQPEQPNQPQQDSPQ